MKHLYFIHKNAIYTRADALCWQDGQQMNIASLKGEGIVIMIKSILQEHTEAEFIAIDCTRLSAVDINFLRQLKDDTQRLKIKANFLFIRNADPTLEDKLREAKFDTKSDDDKQVISAHYNEVSIKKNLYAGIQSEYEECLKETVINYIQDTFSYHDPTDSSKMELLSSTPLFTNGDFDASIILSNPKKYLWTVCYACDKLEEFLLEHDLLNREATKFLAVNLRSAPIAHAMSYLLGFDFFCIDHIGPAHKLFYRDFHKRGFEEGNYVYIGDYMMGGTEVKIAQNYVHFLGGKMNHAFLLGSWVTSKEGRFKGKFEFTCLYSLRDKEGFKANY